MTSDSSVGITRRRRCATVLPESPLERWCVSERESPLDTLPVAIVAPLLTSQANRTRLRRQSAAAGTFRRRLASRLHTFLFATAAVALLTDGLVAAASSSSCRVDACGAVFNRDIGSGKVLIGANRRYCSLVVAYRRCLRQTARACRGDIKYHSFVVIVNQQINQHRCESMKPLPHPEPSSSEPTEETTGDWCESVVGGDAGEYDGHIQRRRRRVVGYDGHWSRQLNLGYDESGRVRHLNFSANASVSPDDRGSFFDSDKRRRRRRQTDNIGLHLRRRPRRLHYRTCALFGDPHVLTVGGRHELCRATGAWPLLNNDYFVVQVTNLPVAVLGARPHVASGSGGSRLATAVSKVTVIVKQHQGCTERRTYEASANDLPSVFTDGTSVVRTLVRNFATDGASASTSYEEDGTSPRRRRYSVELLEHAPGQHVELALRHLSTTIVLRRHGTYLSVVVRMPAAVYASSAADTVQLCAGGCGLVAGSADAAVDYVREALTPTTPERLFARCRRVDLRGGVGRDDATALCRRRQLTGAFLDACVVDLMLTGDLRFVDVGADMQRDWRMLASSTDDGWNRTDLSVYAKLRHNYTGDCLLTDRVASSASLLAASAISTGVLLLLLTCLMLLL